MPCIHCETRDEDRGHAGAVAKIHYREDGETYYTCLNCLIEELKHD